jgi:hypothetical protein
MEGWKEQGALEKSKDIIKCSLKQQQQQQQQQQGKSVSQSIPHILASNRKKGESES